MRQQPYEHLLSTQTTTTHCSIQNTMAGLDNGTSNKNKTNGLSTILGNASNLAKFGNIFSNMMKNNNNQNNLPPQNSNIISNNYPFNFQQQNKNSYTKQAPLPNNSFQSNDPKHQENANSNTHNSLVAQDFPSINPQFSLDTILHPQAKTFTPQNSQNKGSLNDNKRYVLKQMQLHNAYLSRIPHN